MTRMRPPGQRLRANANTEMAGPCVTAKCLPTEFHLDVLSCVAFRLILRRYRICSCCWAFSALRMDLVTDVRTRGNSVCGAGIR